MNKLHVSYMWNLPKSPLFVLLVSAFLKYHPGLRTVMSSCALEIRTEKILLNINNPKLQHEPDES